MCAPRSSQILLQCVSLDGLIMKQMEPWLHSPSFVSVPTQSIRKDLMYIGHYVLVKLVK